MMLYPAMTKLTEYIPNRYMMVNVVARRARQIAQEAEMNGVAEGLFDASTINTLIDTDK